MKPGVKESELIFGRWQSPEPSIIKVEGRVFFLLDVDRLLKYPDGENCDC